LTGEERFGNFWNKLFAQAVNTEINSMLVKTKVFAGRKKNCLQQEPHLKKCLHVKIFQPSSPAPRQKNNGLSLKQQDPCDMATLKKN